MSLDHVLDARLIGLDLTGGEEETYRKDQGPDTEEESQAEPKGSSRYHGVE